MSNTLNRLGNLVLKPLLRSPLHGLVSRRYMLITVKGRKTGHPYTTVVEFLRDTDSFLVFTQKAHTWWKNVRGGGSVTLTVGGHPLYGTASVTTDSPDEIWQAFHRLHPSMAEAKVKPLLPEMVMVRIHI
jgi:deazaflavin-dependent oxidoreductase (nitroreductase family)